jgi:hypothetical protein
MNRKRGANMKKFLPMKIEKTNDEEWENVLREDRIRYIERNMFFDRNGNPISNEEWGRLFQDPKYKIIKQEDLPDEKGRVSTVWLGINHGGFGPHEKREIFETMIFAPGKDYDQYQWRWSTEKEAREGHEYVVMKYTSRIGKIVRWMEGERDPE